MLWRPVPLSADGQPRPRHGHRAAAIGKRIVLFGGGNDGIFNDVCVFDTVTGVWAQPAQAGQLPSGRAAYGLASDDASLFVFGGMLEYGEFSNELFELNTRTWSWRSIDAQGELPQPRIGTAVCLVDRRLFVFGGLVRTPAGPGYLNDMHVCDLDVGRWSKVACGGTPPQPRESHTCVVHNGRIVVFGGMNGRRLADVAIFDIESSSWLPVQTLGPRPEPRSLHSAVVIGNRMLVFGGWVPTGTSYAPPYRTPQPSVVTSVPPSASTPGLPSSGSASYGPGSIAAAYDSPARREWRCTGTLAVLDLASMSWEPVRVGSTVGRFPKGRAGHAAVTIGSRMYVWGGRDEYRRAWNSQICCKDMWMLETGRPSKPTGLLAEDRNASQVVLRWESVENTDGYNVQVRHLEDGSAWRDVGVVRDCACTVTDFVCGDEFKRDEAITTPNTASPEATVDSGIGTPSAATPPLSTEVKGDEIAVAAPSDTHATAGAVEEKRQALQPLTEYVFRVAAVNACGQSEFSSELHVSTTLEGVPGRIVRAKCHKDGGKSLVVTWLPPTECGSSPLLGFVVESFCSDRNEWIVAWKGALNCVVVDATTGIGREPQPGAGGACLPATVCGVLQSTGPRKVRKGDGELDTTRTRKRSRSGTWPSGAVDQPTPVPDTRFPVGVCLEGSLLSTLDRARGVPAEGPAEVDMFECALAGDQLVSDAVTLVSIDDDAIDIDSVGRLEDLGGGGCATSPCVVTAIRIAAFNSYGAGCAFELGVRADPSVNLSEAIQVSFPFDFEMA